MDCLLRFWLKQSFAIVDDMIPILPVLFVINIHYILGIPSSGLDNS